MERSSVRMKLMKVAASLRAMAWVRTSPVRTFSAALTERVPWRTYCPGLLSLAPGAK
jgi:hypothetical protein